jgi:hypothetical protein
MVERPRVEWIRAVGEFFENGSVRWFSALRS